MKITNIILDGKFIFLLIYIFGFLLFVYMHEETHVQIFRSYEIKSKIDWNNLETIPDDKTYYKCNDYCILSHNINEIVSYVVFVLYIMIGYGILVILYSVDSLKEKNLYSNLYYVNHKKDENQIEVEGGE